MTDDLTNNMSFGSRMIWTFSQKIPRPMRKALLFQWAGMALVLFVWVKFNGGRYTIIYKFTLANHLARRSLA